MYDKYQPEQEHPEIGVNNAYIKKSHKLLQHINNGLKLTYLNFTKKS